MIWRLLRVILLKLTVNEGIKLMNSKKVWKGKTEKIHCFGKCKIKYFDLKNALGEEHFVENDLSRTHSGVE